MTKPKILLYDIETLPNIAASFGLWQQNIAPKAILNTTSLICISWKWLGEKENYALSIADYKGWKKNIWDDKKLVADFRDILSEADVVVGHNIDKYDTKYFNTRMLVNGFTALPKVQSIDTYKVAKSKFRLNSNKLSYLADILGCTPKDDMEFEDWLNIVKGDKDAIDKMVDYNIQDVNTLEEVYYKLLSYIPTHPNRNLFSDDGETCCPTCGGSKLHKRGFSFTKIAKRQRYQCKECGSWSLSGKSELIVNVRGL